MENSFVGFIDNRSIQNEKIKPLTALEKIKFPRFLRFVWTRRWYCSCPRVSRPSGRGTGFIRSNRKFNSVDGYAVRLARDAPSNFSRSKRFPASIQRLESPRGLCRAANSKGLGRDERGCLLIISRPRLPPNRPDPRNLSLAPTRFIDTRPLYIRFRILFRSSRYLFTPDLFCRHGQHGYTGVSRIDNAPSSKRLKNDS